VTRTHFDQPPPFLSPLLFFISQKSFLALAGRKSYSWAVIVQHQHAFWIVDGSDHLVCVVVVTITHTVSRKWLASYWNTCWMVRFGATARNSMGLCCLLPIAWDLLLVVYYMCCIRALTRGREGAGTRVRSTQRACHVCVCVMGI
jgi:hypothetical protein